MVVTALGSQNPTAMGPSTESCRRWDYFGTVLSAIVLVVGSLIALFGCQLLGATMQMFREMGEMELPTLFQVAWKLEQAHLLSAFSVSLLFLGLFMLVKVPDRQRANLYAGLVGMLLGLTGGGWIAVAILPILKVVGTMGM